MLLGYLGLGGAVVASGSGPAVGALSLAYGGAGLVSYLGIGLPPVLRALSVNATAGVGAVLGLGTLIAGSANMTLILLSTLFIIDFVNGTQAAEEDVLVREQPEDERIGPIMKFFTSSWKVNGFNKRNFDACQTI